LSENIIKKEAACPPKRYPCGQIKRKIHSTLFLQLNCSLILTNQTNIIIQTFKPRLY